MDRAPADVLAEHHARHELAYPVDAAGRPVWPPRFGVAGWRVSTGNGTVHATTTVHPRDGEPYDVSLVDLDEGFRMMSTVISPRPPAIGDRVRVRWDGDRPVFAP
jgi:uncharacterized OB-fold protein